ncbi:MAG: hypothetical protein NTZ59_02105 [Bacteroidetes bacterium]|nr:hypothetical protein [Bacteroidota bacterium]
MSGNPATNFNAGTAPPFTTKLFFPVEAAVISKEPVNDPVDKIVNVMPGIAASPKTTFDAEPDTTQGASTLLQLNS